MLRLIPMRLTCFLHWGTCILDHAITLIHSVYVSSKLFTLLLSSTWLVCLYLHCTFSLSLTTVPRYIHKFDSPLCVRSFISSRNKFTFICCSFVRSGVGWYSSVRRNLVAFPNIPYFSEILWTLISRDPSLYQFYRGFICSQN